MANGLDSSLDVSETGGLPSHMGSKGKNLFSMLGGIAAALCGIGISVLGGRILPNPWFGGGVSFHHEEKRHAFHVFACSKS
jgi:hypothetical protein